MGDKHNWTWFVSAILFCSLSVYFKANRQDYADPIKVHLGKPESIISYREFQMIYPAESADLNDELNRHLFFTANLIEVSQNNLATLSGRNTFYMQQTPIVSDRTEMEQESLFAEFGLIHLLSSKTDKDYAMSGFLSSSVGKLIRKDKGEPFEGIPNYPLDQQPDPNRITHIDADLRDCLSDVKNQLNCGSCYAFSWNALVEWHYCKQTGEKIDLSAQFMVDCGYKVRLNACVEGRIPDVRDFTQMFGMELEENYPYKGVAGKCKLERGSLDVRVKDFRRIKIDRDEWERTLEEQPILVMSKLPKDIMSYRRGIHPGVKCGKRSGGHGILLVGHGRQDGAGYWLLKNSVGKRWGEDGYLRLSKEASLEDCFKTAYVSKFKFVYLDEDIFKMYNESFSFKPSVVPDNPVRDLDSLS